MPKDMLMPSPSAGAGKPLALPPSGLPANSEETLQALRD